MRAVVQRVSSASVATGGEKIAAIGEGALILLGIEEADGAEDVEWLAGKIVRLRIFTDASGVMNCSLRDTGGDLLVVSQFTLHASTRKGNRPSYTRAMRPERARAVYEMFCDTAARELGQPVQRGEFGATMQVALINDGPVTITIDTKNRE